MIASARALPFILLATIGMVAMLIVLFKALRGRVAVGLVFAMFGIVVALLFGRMGIRRHVAVRPRITGSYTDTARSRAVSGKSPHPPGAVDLTAPDTMLEQLSELAEQGVETAQSIAHDSYEMAITQHDGLMTDEILATEATKKRLGSPASVEVRVPVRHGIRTIVRHASSRSEGNRAWRTSILHNILTALEIAAFLCVAYVFLDGATRGQFTWALRLVSVVAFAAIYVALTSLRHQL